MSASNGHPLETPWEGHVAESVLYGLLAGMFESWGPVIAKRFAFRGIELRHARAADERLGVHYVGLVVHMASGDYEISVRRA